MHVNRVTASWFLQRLPHMTALSHSICCSSFFFYFLFPPHFQCHGNFATPGWCSSPLEALEVAWTPPFGTDSGAWITMRPLDFGWIGRQRSLSDVPWFHPCSNGWKSFPGLWWQRLLHSLGGFFLRFRTWQRTCILLHGGLLGQGFDPPTRSTPARPGLVDIELGSRLQSILGLDISLNPHAFFLIFWSFGLRQK